MRNTSKVKSDTPKVILITPKVFYITPRVFQAVNNPLKTKTIMLFPVIAVSFKNPLQTYEKNMKQTNFGVVKHKKPQTEV